MSTKDGPVVDTGAATSEPTAELTGDASLRQALTTPLTRSSATVASRSRSTGFIVQTRECSPPFWPGYHEGPRPVQEPNAYARQAIPETSADRTLGTTHARAATTSTGNASFKLPRDPNAPELARLSTCVNAVSQSRTAPASLAFAACERQSETASAISRPGSDLTTSSMWALHPSSASRAPLDEDSAPRDAHVLHVKRQELSSP